MFAKKTILFVLIFALQYSRGLSQNPMDKKQAKKTLKEAKVFFDIEDYSQAFQLYKKILQFNADDEITGLNAAICVNKLNYSLDSSLMLIPNLTASKHYESKFYLAKIKHNQKQFDEAISLLNNYLTIDLKKRKHQNAEVNYLINVCNNAKTLTLQPHRSLIKNMGTNINPPIPKNKMILLDGKCG